jgi:hypothetical protein
MLRRYINDLQLTFAIGIAELLDEDVGPITLNAESITVIETATISNDVTGINQFTVIEFYLHRIAQEVINENPFL